MSNKQKFKCGDVIYYAGPIGKYTESERWIGLIIGIDKQYYKYKVIRTIHDAITAGARSMGLAESKTIEDGEYLVL